MELKEIEKEEELKEDFYVLKVLFKHKKEILEASNFILKQDNIEGSIFDYKDYPGYLFVKMDYNPVIFKKISCLEGVTGFIGNNKPIKTKFDSNKLKKRNVMKSLKIQVGDIVCVKKGVFAESQGIVEKIVSESKVVINVMFLGRMTPLEVGMHDIKL